MTALLAAPAPVAAHELGAVLVVPARAEGAGGSALEGFRLAVDQSPDVSHPPGAAAGDHLGGIDVDLTVVRSRDSGAVARDVGRAVSGGARVVVVLRRARAERDRQLTSEIVRRLGPSSPLIVVAGTRATLPAKLAVPVVLLGDRPPARIQRARLARFELRFTRRHRSAPDRAARTGYDAGRLVDRLLARIGEGPFRAAAIGAAVPEADRALIATTARIARADRERGDASASRLKGAGGGAAPVAAIAAAGSAGAVVALLLVHLTRRRRSARR